MMNANTKNHQMEHCPCPKYGMIYGPDKYSLQVSKKTSENEQVLKYAATESPPVSILPEKQDGLKSDVEYAD